MGFSFQDLIGLVVLAALIATPIVLWKRKKRIVAVMFGIVFALLWIALALPGLKRSRTVGYRALCITNLKVIQNAKTEWSKQNNRQPADVPTETDLVGVGKQLSEMPKCPDGGIFSLGAVSQKPTCSLSEKGHVIPDEDH